MYFLMIKKYKYNKLLAYAIFLRRSQRHACWVFAFASSVEHCMDGNRKHSTCSESWMMDIVHLLLYTHE